MHGKPEDIIAAAAAFGPEATDGADGFNEETRQVLAGEDVVAETYVRADDKTVIVPIIEGEADHSKAYVISTPGAKVVEDEPEDDSE